MKRMLVNASIVLVSVLITLAAVEIALRIFSLPDAPLCGWKHTSGVPETELNQLGFRGREYRYDDSDYVILLLGDSQVEAVGCGFHEMPERYLESALDSLLPQSVRVFSLGAPGYGQDQEYLALLHYTDSYRADMVVLWETPANDIWNNIFPTHWPGTSDGWSKPTFWLEDGELRGPSAQLGDEVRASELRIADLLMRGLGDWSFDRSWEERLPPAYTPLDGYSGDPLPDWQRRWDEDEGLMRQENLSTGKSHLSIYLTPRSPRMDYAVELADRLLQEIGSHLDSCGTELVVFATDNVPDSSAQVDYAVYLLNGELYAVSEEQYLRNVEDMNASVRFIPVPITIEDWRISPTDSHLNPNANRQVMQYLADSLAGLIRGAPEL